MQKQFLFLTTALLLLLVFSCGQQAENTTSSGNGNKQMNNDSLQKFKLAYSNGAQLFKQQCAGCHTAPLEDNEFNILDKIAGDSLQWCLNYIKDSRPFKGKESPESKKFLAEFPSNYAHVFKDSLSDGQLNDLVLFMTTKPQ